MRRATLPQARAMTSVKLVVRPRSAISLSASPVVAQITPIINHILHGSQRLVLAPLLPAARPSSHRRRSRHQQRTLAMVNVDVSPSVILGVGLIGAGVSLWQIRQAKPWISRDYDVVISCISLLVGGILIFQGWRLDPLLLFGQLMTTGAAVSFAVEALKLRSEVYEEDERAELQDVFQRRGGPGGYRGGAELRLPPPPPPGMASSFRGDDVQQGGWSAGIASSRWSDGNAQQYYDEQQQQQQQQQQPAEFYDYTYQGGGQYDDAGGAVGGYDASPSPPPFSNEYYASEGYDTGYSGGATTSGDGYYVEADYYPSSANVDEATGNADGYGYDNNTNDDNAASKYSSSSRPSEVAFPPRTPSSPSAPRGGGGRSSSSTGEPFGSGDDWE